MDPILPILSVLGYMAIILGTVEVQADADMLNTPARHAQKDVMGKLQLLSNPSTLRTNYDPKSGGPKCFNLRCLGGYG